ncbi:hypothetical protein I5K78_32865 [Pseudomonas aeruginosa]|nr:hypothetical protein [Pseudomonas aeruginosa]
MRRTVGLPAEDSQPSTPDLFNEAMYDLKLNGFGTTLALNPPAWAIISRSSSPDISKAYQWSRFTEAGIDAVGFGSSVEKVVREALELGAVDIAPRDVLESLSRRPSFDAQGFSVDSIMRMRLGEAPTSWPWADWWLTPGWQPRSTARRRWSASSLRSCLR